MRKLKETGFMRKALNSAVATVLAVGLMPMPAFAADLTAGTAGLNAQAASTEGYVVCAAYAAAEPAPQILGLNNPQYRNEGEAQNVAAIFGQDTNSAPDPFLVNMLNGETPAPIYGGRQGSPMSALLPYNTDTDAGALSQQVWNMKPDIVLGTGSDDIPDNEATFYDTDEYARAAEAANGWTANSYHPVGVTYNRVDLNAMINTMYRLAIAADTAVAGSDGALQTRYDSAMSIARDYERYITGAKGYVLKAINEGAVPERTFACVQSYDASAGTFQIRPSGILAEGTATRNRLIEAVQGVAKNYYDESSSAVAEDLKTVSVDELKNNVDFIIVNVNAGSDTDDGIVNALNAASLLSKSWYASDMSVGAVFGTTVNSVENAQNVGRILPCLYPELLDQSDMIAYYYDTFYHIQSGAVASTVAEKMDGVRNWNANSSADTGANLQWDEADVADYSRMAVESEITEGMDYMLSLTASQIPDAVMTPTAYYTQDEIAPAPAPVTDAVVALDETGAVAGAADEQWAAEAIASVPAGVALATETTALTLDTASEAAAKAWQAAIDAGALAVSGYDVDLYVLNSEGKPVAQLTDDLKIKVTLPVDAKYDGKLAKVTQVHGGEAAELADPVAVEDGAVTFEVSELSEFVIAVQDEDAPIFSVYAQVGDDTPWLVKSYTSAEFASLATDEGPVSGLYYKGNVWNVSTAITYVTLDDLFADAEINWGMGASIGYGGDPAQGKTSNSFTFGQLQNTYFYPNTTATETDTEGAVKAPFVLGVLTSDAGVAIGDDQTAADVQSAAAEASTIEHAPYAIVGSLESEYVAADGTTVQGKRLWRNVDAITVKYPAASSAMYRLYNPYSGEHFYTSSITERDGLVPLGWNYEGVGWYAPDSEEAAPVYRLYNKYVVDENGNGLGDHHYTTSEEERDTLIAAGWDYEGIGWRTAPDTGVPVYREYNPYAYGLFQSGAHNYTTSLEEHEFLGAVGWGLEGTAWFGMGVA